ncbi:serine/threonine-protein kinase [Sanguibacter sp. 25GB23B1]|uniref:serine/threonine-protein kinase n=1 Tax=unclassified Sanguibacter TaxID=2645534 RepID=UPI0032AEA25D
MSTKRPPSPPPEIQGYEYLRVIGSGGFADVFLYQEFRPRRQVAIKVLLPQWSDGTTREAFAAEADLMAAVSSHPSIVTIFDSDVTDDGRLYLAMEYCSRPNLSARYKKERLGIAETLRIGVQIAGAVETAHRSGIVHRDIKPANILVTDYGHPALTDFGISATIEQSEAGADGMSVPWSPPENLTATPCSGVTSDVWSLAATIYTLLAGRSPFEVPGGVNTQRALIERITHDPLPPIGRGDVPASLERVLAVAMAKSPAMRYPTVLEMARELQQVQMELSLATSPIDILEGASVGGDERPAAHHDGALADDDGGTRMRLATDRYHPAYGVAHSEGSARGPVRSRTPSGVADSLSGSIGHDSSSLSYGSINGVPYVPVDERRHAGAVTGRPVAASGAPSIVAPPPSATTTGSASTSASSTSASHGYYTTTGTASPTGTGSGGGTAATGSGGWSGGAAPDPSARPTGLVAFLRQPAVLVVALAVLVGIGGGFGVYLTFADPGGSVPAAEVPQPADLSVTVSGSVAVFVWSNPDAQDGDFYAYRPVLGAEGSEGETDPESVVPLKQTSALTASVNTFGVDEACLEVAIVRGGRLSAEPAVRCLE